MNDKRNTIISNAVEAIESNGFRGTGVLSMGTGKTKLGIDCIKKGKFTNILVIFPLDLKANWRAELEKWGISGNGLFKKNTYIANVELETVQTVHKWPIEKFAKYDLMIADEIHSMATDVYSRPIKIFSEILKKPVIGLTGTPDDKKPEKKEFYNLFCPIIFKYLDSEKDGLINKKNIFIYKYPLTDRFQVEVGARNKKFKKGEFTQYKYLEAQYIKGQQAMISQESENWFEDAKRWYWGKEGTTEQRAAGMKFMNAIKYRKMFLWNLESSAYYAKVIKSRILETKNNKVMLFSNRNQQVNKLSKNVVHSDKSAKHNESMVKMFNADYINEIASCGKLKMGYNLTGVNYVIMESFDGSDVMGPQKMSRANRLKSDEEAKVIWIVPKDTQAEKWCINALKDVPTSTLTIVENLAELGNYI